jgi:hypothetical protein
MSGFKPVELFGGAITADFPAAFGDVRYVSTPSSSGSQKDGLSQRPRNRSMFSIETVQKQSTATLQVSNEEQSAKFYLRGKRTLTDPSPYSNIRQVPDNQEVYLDGDGFTSVVVEILEREEKPDNEALEYHLRDLVEDDEDDAAEKTKVWWRGEAVGGKLP